MDVGELRLCVMGISFCGFEQQHCFEILSGAVSSTSALQQQPEFCASSVSLVPTLVNSRVSSFSVVFRPAFRSDLSAYWTLPCSTAFPVLVSCLGAVIVDNNVFRSSVKESSQVT